MCVNRSKIEWKIIRTLDSIYDYIAFRVCFVLDHKLVSRIKRYLFVNNFSSMKRKTVRGRRKTNFRAWCALAATVSGDGVVAEWLPQNQQLLNSMSAPRYRILHPLATGNAKSPGPSVWAPPSCVSVWAQLNAEVRSVRIIANTYITQSVCSLRPTEWMQAKFSRKTFEKQFAHAASGSAGCRE